MMDFNVYWVYSGTRRLFGIYEGNSPNLGDDHLNGRGMDDVRLGQIEAKISRTKSPTGTCSAQYLIQTRHAGWPTQIQAWCTDQPEATAKAIEAILQTIELTNPKE